MKKERWGKRDRDKELEKESCGKRDGERDMGKRDEKT